MGERAWIAKYFMPLAASPGAAALLDDVAELSAGEGPLIATVDALVEGVHFLASDPIESVARKLVRANVSDILSKGARPREALLTLGWPQGRTEKDLARFAQALGEEISAWNVQLVGGDTTSIPAGLFLSLTLTGVCGPRGPIRRKGARAGDSLWVTGEIGAALRGFRALQLHREDDPWVSAYRQPALPPLAIAGLVQDYATASMDVSDGLLGDAQMLAAASGLALVVDLGKVPYAGSPVGLEERLELAIWGDDYQILFATPATSDAMVASQADQQGIRITRIGEFVTGSGLSAVLEGKSVNLPETLGFEHG